MAFLNLILSERGRLPLDGLVPNYATPDDAHFKAASDILIRSSNVTHEYVREINHPYRMLQCEAAKAREAGLDRLVVRLDAETNAEVLHWDRNSYLESHNILLPSEMSQLLGSPLMQSAQLQSLLKQIWALTPELAQLLTSPQLQNSVLQSLLREMWSIEEDLQMPRPLPRSEARSRSSSPKRGTERRPKKPTPKLTVPHKKLSTEEFTDKRCSDSAIEPVKWQPHH